jgi:hypothetical protein
MATAPSLIKSFGSGKSSETFLLLISRFCFNLSPEALKFLSMASKPYKE